MSFSISDSNVLILFVGGWTGGGDGGGGGLAKSAIVLSHKSKALSIFRLRGSTFGDFCDTDAAPTAILATESDDSEVGEAADEEDELVNRWNPLAAVQI